MMWSSSPGCARPVRTLERSVLNASIVFFILTSVVSCSSAICMTSSLWSSNMDQRAFVLSEDYALQRALAEDAEHVDRQLLVAAERERGGVHHLQVARDRFVEGQLRVALGRRIFLGVRGVDAVDLGGLDDDFGADLAAAQRGGGIGCEERVSGARGKDHDLAFIQVADH